MARAAQSARAVVAPETGDLAAFRKAARAKRRGPHFYVALLGLDAFETPALLRSVEAGFPYRAFERFQRNVDLPTDALASLLQLPRRTLARRREEGRLTAEESDRLLRAARLFGHAIALFEGDVAAARAWFSTPARALGRRTPLDVASTEVGAREVEQLLGRLEHGVFS